MSKTTSSISEEHALSFCAGLNQSERRGLALCIDRRIVEGGYAGGLRAGNTAWMRARLQAVTEIIRREDDLSVLREEIENGVNEARRSDDEGTRDAAKAALKRVDVYAEFLLEEAREHQGQTVLEDEELDEAA